MIEIWTMLLPAAAPAIWFLFCLTALIKLARYRKRRLLRCPETGGVAIVDIEETSLTDQDGGRSYLRVRNCRLWPERRHCGRGCLTRCTLSWGSYGFDLASLKPFEDHNSKQPTSLPH